MSGGFIGLVIGAVLAAAGGAWAIMHSAKGQRGRDASDTLKRTQEGRDAVADARRDDRSPADRLRDNDAEW